MNRLLLHVYANALSGLIFSPLLYSPSFQINLDCDTLLFNYLLTFYIRVSMQW